MSMERKHSMHESLPGTRKRIKFSSLFGEKGIKNPAQQLNIACRLGDFEKVESLLLNYPDIDINNINTPLITAISEGFTDIVELLLMQPRVDVNQVNRYGQTPLKAAVQKRFTDIIKLLSSHPNIDINKPNCVEETPLHFAVSIGNRDAAELLLSHPDIDINKLDRKGKTPLDIAFKNNNMIDLILTHKRQKKNSLISTEPKE